MNIYYLHMAKGGTLERNPFKGYLTKLNEKAFLKKRMTCKYLRECFPKRIDNKVLIEAIYFSVRESSFSRLITIIQEKLNCFLKDKGEFVIYTNSNISFDSIAKPICTENKEDTP